MKTGIRIRQTASRDGAMEKGKAGVRQKREEGTCTCTGTGTLSVTKNGK